VASLQHRLDHQRVLGVAGEGGDLHPLTVGAPEEPAGHPEAAPGQRDLLRQTRRRRVRPAPDEHERREHALVEAGVGDPATAAAGAGQQAGEDTGGDQVYRCPAGQGEAHEHRTGPVTWLLVHRPGTGLDEDVVARPVGVGVRRRVDRPQIGSHRAFAAVRRPEQCAVAEPVAPDRLHLDHLGAVLGEQLGGDGPGDPGRHVDDPQPRE